MSRMPCRPLLAVTPQTTRSGTQISRNMLALVPSAVRPNDPLRRNNVMRILIAIIMIGGACFVLLVGLLSVVRDLLLITSRHALPELDGHAMGREGSAVYA